MVACSKALVLRYTHHDELAAGLEDRTRVAPYHFNAKVGSLKREAISLSLPANPLRVRNWQAP
jgi:hypothetical protein